MNLLAGTTDNKAIVTDINIYCICPEFDGFMNIVFFFFQYFLIDMYNRKYTLTCEARQ